MTCVRARRQEIHAILHVPMLLILHFFLLLSLSRFRSIFFYEEKVRAFIFCWQISLAQILCLHFHDVISSTPFFRHSWIFLCARFVKRKEYNKQRSTAIRLNQWRAVCVCVCDANCWYQINDDKAENSSRAEKIIRAHTHINGFKSVRHNNLKYIVFNTSFQCKREHGKIEICVNCVCASKKPKIQ